MTWPIYFAAGLVGLALVASIMLRLPLAVHLPLVLVALWLLYRIVRVVG